MSAVRSVSRNRFQSYWDGLHQEGRMPGMIAASSLLHIFLLLAAVVLVQLNFGGDPPKPLEVMVFAATDLDAQTMTSTGAPDLIKGKEISKQPAPPPPQPKAVAPPPPPVEEKPTPPEQKVEEKPEPKELEKPKEEKPELPNAIKKAAEPEKKEEKVAKEETPKEKPKKKEEKPKAVEPKETPKKEKTKPKEPKPAEFSEIEPMDEEEVALESVPEPAVQMAQNNNVGGAVQIGETSGVSLNPGMASWTGRVQRDVEPEWIKPSGIFLSAELSTVVVVFTVDRDGNLLSEPQSATPGSDPRLADSAVQAVKRAAPLPPLPASFLEPEIKVEYTFVLEG